MTAWSVCLRLDWPALQTPRSACCEGVGSTGVDGKSCFLRGGQMLLASVLSSGVVHLFDGSRPRCLMRAPLAATEWQADRALDATVWHENRYMRSCQEMSCHSTPSSGTTIAHSVTASGTTEPRKKPASARTPRCGALAGGRGRAVCGQVRRLSLRRRHWPACERRRREEHCSTGRRGSRQLPCHMG